VKNRKESLTSDNRRKKNRISHSLAWIGRRGVLRSDNSRSFNTPVENGEATRYQLVGCEVFGFGAFWVLSEPIAGSSQGIRCCGKLRDMTNQQTNQRPRFQHREDYKVQKLVERVEKKIALQAKGTRQASQLISKN
jgi:hypothetical protein